ncbi:MAG: DUF3656 domain-containing U32 family peptidase [Mycoplasmatales bacterium]
MEVLAPVKNYQAACVAIQNGCDALYLSSPNFGARSNASLKMSEIEKIVDYANNYKVKTFITFNTVIFENELDELFSQINQVYNIGASGVILQDFALIDIISKKYPDLEIHCSTQMNINNTYATKLVMELGANRVVVPREMSFNRIKQIYEQTNVDIEAFVHGALCVSYSGQCYDSTLLDQKSANRGRCSQYCRMPQKIINNRNGNVISVGYYPLNLKDLNNINNVDKYIKAGVNSIKIEGRLKQLDYTGNTVKHYKEQVDNYFHDRCIKIDENTMRQSYNREFTTGRISGINGSDLVNLYKPNNSGVKIGEVINVEQNNNDKLSFYKYIITIKSKTPIILMDNIRFMRTDFEDGQVVEQIEVFNNEYKVYSNVAANTKDIVYKTHDFNLYQMHKQLSFKFNRRRMVNVDLYLDNNVIYYKIDEFNINESTYIKMQTPVNMAVDIDTIFDKLSKTNDTPYSFVLTFKDYNSDLYISFSDIKKIKNLLIKELENINTIRHEEKQFEYTKSVFNEQVQGQNKYYVEVKTLKQYQIAKEFDDVVVLINNLDIIKDIVFDDNDFIVMPKILYDDELKKVLDEIKEYKNICISELGGLKYFDKKNLMTNFSFNTTNLISQKKLVELGVDKTIISIELNREKISHMANNHTVVNIYGRVPVMTMDFCPINLEKSDTCGSCTRCHSGNYALLDEYERKFPLLYEGNFRIAMYSKDAISLFTKVDELNDFGIYNFNIRLTNENEEQTRAVLKAIKNHNNRLPLKTSTGSYYKETL